MCFTQDLTQRYSASINLENQNNISTCLQSLISKCNKFPFQKIIIMTKILPSDYDDHEDVSENNLP